jgi:hypothetical protein
MVVAALFDPIVRLLDAFLCYVKQFIFFIADALIWTANMIVLALATLLAPLLDTMPDIPTAPTMPTEMTQVLGWIAWVFNIGALLDFLSFIVVAWVIWQFVALVLRWAKATGE